MFCLLQVLEVVEDFNYICVGTASKEQDLKVCRRALVWSALYGMKREWKSEMGVDLKRRLFVVTVESVLLCGAETWMLTVQQEKALDGAYKNATNGT